MVGLPEQEGWGLRILGTEEGIKEPGALTLGVICISHPFYIM